MIKKTNAIEMCVEEIGDRYREFARTDAAVLRWLVNSETARLIELFVDLQNEDTECAYVGALFLSLTTSFTNAEDYGSALRENLLEYYDYQGIRTDEGEWLEQATSSVLEQEGLPVDWTCPVVDTTPENAAQFLKVVNSFQNYYETRVQELVIVCSPEQVENSQSWYDWWSSLLESLSCNPQERPSVRFMLVDLLDETAPEKADSANQFWSRWSSTVKTIEHDAGLAEACRDLVMDVPGYGDGYAFRRLFVFLVTAASLNEAKEAAQEALKGAEKLTIPEAQCHLQQKSRDELQQKLRLEMQAMVHMAMGGRHFAEKDFDSACDSYRQAEKLVQNLNTTNARKLRLQSVMSRAGVTFSQATSLPPNRVLYKQAGEEYQDAAGLLFSASDAPAVEAASDPTRGEEILAAEQQASQVHLIDCCRMSAYCFLKAGDIEGCHEIVERLMTLLEEQPDWNENELRLNTTLPWLGQMFIEEKRLTNPSYNDTRDRLDKLMGEGWREVVNSEAASE